ncbi:MAG TPA: hypothetical protein VHC40_04960 [Rhizomicrobium sp.]|jgi:hypothetical protein|nr:hypothetical protein [Rhizomicrobium sp.]
MRNDAAIGMLWMAAAALLALGACAGKPVHMPLGAKIAPPTGAIGYCRRNPEDELCL